MREVSQLYWHGGERIGLPFRWPLVKDVGSGFVTQPTVFLRFDGDNLGLWNSSEMPVLAWPNGDRTPTRRWCLSMKVTGLCEEWSIELCVNWTLGTKSLALMEYAEPLEQTQRPAPVVILSERTNPPGNGPTPPLPPKSQDQQQGAPDLEERKAAYARCKLIWKAANANLTEEKLAKLAHPKWNTRDPIAKWKAGLDQPGDDARIRRAMAMPPEPKRRSTA